MLHRPVAGGGARGEGGLESLYAFDQFVFVSMDRVKYKTMVMVAKMLSIKRIRIFFKLYRDNSNSLYLFHFRRILLQVDSYCPIPSSLKKRKEKLSSSFYVLL